MYILNETSVSCSFGIDKGFFEHCGKENVFGFRLNLFRLTGN